MKLLVILSRIPYPLEKGDKLRAWHQLRYLSQKCELHLCCLNDAGPVPGAEEALRPFCKSLTIIPLNKAGIYANVIKSLFTAAPLQVGYFYNYSAHKKISELIDRIAPDHIYCQLLRVARYVHDCKLPMTLDYQDVFSKGYERQAENVSWIKRPVFRREARLLRRCETEIFSWFDHHTIISKTDRDEIQHPRRDQISIIHNGVDMDYFSPMQRDKDIDLLFTGNMNYPPNILGAEFLVKKILPELIRIRPGIRVMIAGATPTSSVKSLASENVLVTGWMDDIREAFARSRVFVAPMTIGTGLQNKLLEAMAMKIPCITSPLANAALEANPGEHILECANEQEYVQAILRLLDDHQYAQQLADRALQFVTQNYQWDNETEKLWQFINAANK